ncbi:MAG: hypothetical protein LIO54_03655 [Oscillospiraceae bacterium]|nr:hypothetical protein [Oscillospiraceae bacterium]
MARKTITEAEQISENTEQISESTEKTRENTEQISESTEIPKAAAEPEDTGGFCIYIGPTIKGAMQHGAILPGDRAAALSRPEAAIATAKHPEIAALIVPGTEIAAAKRAMTERGTPEYAARRALRKSTGN